MILIGESRCCGIGPAGPEYDLLQPTWCARYDETTDKGSSVDRVHFRTDVKKEKRDPRLKEWTRKGIVRDSLLQRLVQFLSHLENRN